MHAQFLIVGVGASAGGIESLQVFFANVPANSGHAYVVILHLSPDHASNLAAILQNVTSLPVTAITEQVRVEPNHVYVISPNQHLSMVDGSIAVTATSTAEERRAPIDLFFRTLAETHDGHGVCVVLSGTGADGSLGLKRVKERGGAVFVQEPSEAAFAEMPRSAIATDFVDAVLPVAAIPARIVAYGANVGRVSIAAEPELRPADQDLALRELFSLLRTRTGHNFANYKRATLLRRIERRITVHSLPDLLTYVRFVHEHAEETQALLKDLLISVTNFFRDPAAFAVLDQEVLAKFFTGNQPHDQVRLWVAGCATGEEAYSLAILCAERSERLLEAPQVQIFATDIDEAALARARSGLYTTADTADISPERLRRFFIQEDGRYRVRSELREVILFANHNLLTDPPFSQIDLVSCRNLLIYLDRGAQERVLETFHFALKVNSFLFLGNAETTDSSNSLFLPVNREQRIFQRHNIAVRTLPPFEFGVIPQSNPPVPLVATEEHARVGEHLHAIGLHRLLLEQYAPPSLVVKTDFTLVHLTERAGRYLQFSGGEPTNDLLALIRPELRAALRSALFQAVQHQTPVEIQNLTVRVEERSEQLNLHVRPVLQQDDPTRGFLLVLFEPQIGAARPRSEAALPDDKQGLRQREEELQRLRQQLRFSAEQYEVQAEELKAANEEQQALNEELRTAAEEQTTSREELQSVNEELRTLNQELKIKVEESTQTSANLQNLVNATNIATIFLDRSLRIKLFTPAAQALFNLIPLDQGRELADITHRLVETDVLANAEQVFATLQTVEREVRSLDGQVYLLRIIPYRVGDDRIGGVVLTFFDITARTQAEERVRASEERQSFLLNLSDALRDLSDPSAIQATASRVLGEHLNSDRAYYVELDEARGEYVVAQDWHRPGAPSHARRYPLSGWPMPWLSDGKTWVVRDVTTDPAMPDDQREAYRGNDIGAAVVVPLIKDGRLVATFVTNQRAPRPWSANEVTLIEETAERTWTALERARAEASVRASEEQFRRTIEEAPIPVIMHAEDGEVLQISRNWTELTGYSLADVPTLDAWLNHSSGDGANTVRTYVHALFAGNQRTLNAAFDVRTRAGELRHWSFSASSPGTLHDGRRFVVGMALDITERTRVERALAEQAPLLDLSNDAIIVRDLDNRIVYWNGGATELYGWSREQAVGQDLHTLLRMEFEAPFAELVASLREHDRMEGEVVQETRDGRRITTLCRWALDRDAADRPGAILTSYNDITARKRIEADLRESEARFRTLADAVPQLIWTDDAAGLATYFNQRWYEYSGLSEAASVGPGWQVVVHPDDSLAAVEAWQQALAIGEAFESEYRLRRTDGAYRWHLGRNVPLRDEASRIVGWFGTATDIEELKLAEAARYESAMLRRLAVAQEEERLRIARDLHDQLGQQITGLLLGLKQLEKPLLGTADAALLAPLQELALDMAKETHRLAVNLRPTALEDLGLVPALQEFVADWGAQSGIVAAFQYVGTRQDRLPREVEVALYRVVQEALTNVQKHAGATNVGVILEWSAERVSLIVEDNGEGFDPGEAQDIKNGSGLGLLGMRERIAEVGGTLAIEAAPERGATLLVRIACP